jgi:hypothetical protein
MVTPKPTWIPQFLPIVIPHIPDRPLHITTNTPHIQIPLAQTPNLASWRTAARSARPTHGLHLLHTPASSFSDGTHAEPFESALLTISRVLAPLRPPLRCYTLIIDPARLRDACSLSSTISISTTPTITPARYVTTHTLAGTQAILHLTGRGRLGRVFYTNIPK